MSLYTLKESVHEHQVSYRVSVLGTRSLHDCMSTKENVHWGGVHKKRISELCVRKKCENNTPPPPFPDGLTMKIFDKKRKYIPHRKKVPVSRKTKLHKGKLSRG
jgi:hypothetical protein